MGRGVAHANNYVSRIYFLWEFDDSLDFDDLVIDIQDILKTKYTSFISTTGWLEDEVKLILVNEHAYVTVSEYCGMICVCLVARQYFGWHEMGLQALADGWCNQITSGFEKTLNNVFNTAKIVAVGSNGIPLYSMN